MILLATAVGGAYGQGAPARDLQTVVVTAQKREQAAQSVPVSLTAISGKELEDAGIDSAALLDQVAPGLTVSSYSAGYLSITIRGISDLDGGLLGTPATGFYIDETPLSAFAFQLPQVAYWDAQRVEVLRGPQGTLFGEGSMGGTIRLITTKPDATDFAARVMLGRSQVAGGGRGVTARAMVNLPLQSDVLALRVTASRQDIIGWIDVPELRASDSNSGKSEDARIALRWTPSRRFNVDLSYAYQVLDSKDFSATSPGVYRPRDINPAAQAPSFLSTAASRYDLANLTFNVDLGPAALVGSLSRYERWSTVRADLTPFVPLVFGVGGTAERGAAALTVKATTAELRLVSHGDHGLDWTVGAYAKDDAREQAHGGVVISLPELGLTRDETLYTMPARNRALALFADAELKLTSDWALQAGLRHYKADNHTRVHFDTTSAIFPGFTAGVVRDSGGSASATSPKLGLSWKPSAELLVFAKVSTGFRDGDSNYQAPGYPEIPASFDPEKIRAYELGLKTQPSRWLSVNVSIYQNHWTDLQLPFVTADNLFAYIQNAGKAKATGAEIEIAARPMAGLRLGLNLASVDSRIEEDVPNGAGAGAIKGKRIPFSPGLQASMSAACEFELRGGLGATVSANYAHRGATYSEPSNNPALKNAAYNNLYLKAGVHGKVWGSNLFVSNATNSSSSHQKTSAVAGGIVLTNYVQPRTVGVEVDASF
jgi:outer membrane receptor protein involved in Fe transport